jgi:1-acyl-sn-glycerol-3-phosphate acyltransferase
MMANSVLGRQTRAPVEEEVLRTASQLVGELGTMPPSGTVRLDDSLDRDLGLGSLERVELFFRLEQRLGVRLPDQVMGEADTLHDVARAIVAAEPSPVDRYTPVVPPTYGAAPPSAAETLVDVLRWHVEAAPARPHIVLHGEDAHEQIITHEALWQAATAVAAGLLERGVQAGQSVALMLRTEAAFFAAFSGTLLAGAVPVPLYPPARPGRLEEYAARQVAILRNAEARLLLTFPEVERVAAILRPRVPSLSEVTWVERISRPGDALAVTNVASMDDPALIQYTSGSTGDPKGVLLTHANILANIRAIGEALRIGPPDVGVSWLPLYHDMGLIGAWLGSLYHGIPVVILPPLAFLARPSRWLWALHRHRGTLSPAPNFAFDLCVTKVRDDEIVGLDLSAWRLAMNGSESVSPDTIERFTRRFAAYGFRPEAMCPVYGLAEASVGLTVSPPGRLPRIDRVSRDAFVRTRTAAPAAAHEATPLRFVSCGRPLPGHAVRITTPDGQAVGERVEGGVEFRGPSVTSGYFRNPQLTAAVRRDAWMDSGDLGYWADGELFITGRRKDMIKKAGRNLYPQEIEEVVGDLPGVRKGCVAAFGVADPGIGTERLVVIAESRQTAPLASEQLRVAIRDRVVSAIGVPPDTIVVAEPGAVLKTSSGKIRRSATRDAYLGGDLGRRRASPRVQWARLVAGSIGARLRSVISGARTLAFALHVGAVLLALIPPLWLAIRLLPAPRLEHVVRLWCKTVLTLAGCRPRLEGAANLPGGGILAANHSSYLDVVALLATLPVGVRFVAKRELERTPLVGTVIRKVGHPTVERFDLSRSVADAERVAQALRRGVPLLFFPEGTFTVATGLLPFRLGAFKAAMEVNCPIVPIAILGTREILPAERWLPRRGPVTVSVGRPIPPAGDGWREIVRLRDLTRAAITRRLAEGQTAAAGASAAGHALSNGRMLR